MTRRFDQKLLLLPIYLWRGRMHVDPESVFALFDRAARHAVAFRTAEAPKHRPDMSYADAVGAFLEPLPEQGAPGCTILDELARRAAAGLHATTRPRFFGWVIGGSHPVGVAADWLTAAWGQNAGNHVVSPAAAAVEAVASRWLLDLLALPPEASVGFVTGATMANFVGLAAARSEVLRRQGWSVEENGLFGAPPVTVLIGEDAHVTVFSALHYLGFGRGNLVSVASDDQGAMRPDALSEALAESRGPLIVVLQAGQINTGAFDPFPRLVPLAHQHGAWVHVDGAFGLWARACPTRAHLALGADAADSWATDGHKWLQTPYDAGYVMVRDPEAHRRAMTMAASYLPPADGSERDPSQFVPELSRRARGFATWAMLKHLGRSGLAALVERHCEQARLFAALLRDEPGIAVLNDVVLNQVIVRFGADQAAVPGDAQTLDTIACLQHDGTCFAGAARWRDRWVMRLSVINAATTDHDIRLSAEAILRCWRDVRDGQTP